MGGGTSKEVTGVASSNDPVRKSLHLMNHQVQHSVLNKPLDGSDLKVGSATVSVCQCNAV
jgi:hypothetical protein